ncbi:MAG: PEP-CTERM sorting domain-containing protein [Gemmataceae bacterium]
MRKLFLTFAVFCAMTMMPSRVHAAFHAWQINELYSNSTGTVQFIEFTTPAGGNQFVGGQSITVHNIGDTIQHTFTIPTDLPGDSTNHKFLIGTSNLVSSGGPAPDYMFTGPNFLFTAGGSFTFFGANPGTYNALPTNGTLSYNYPSGTTGINSPTNFSGQVGSVPEPTTLILAPLALGSLYLAKRRRNGKQETVADV